MRPRSIILFVLALGCGLVAAIGINQVMANRSSAPALNGETLPIFVALADVELGEPLAPAVLKLEPWPKDKVPVGALSKIEDIEGRRPRTKLFAGEPILENKLLSKDASLQGASGFIPKGMRVVAVKVDAVSGSSGLLLPGDRVDVLVQIQANPSRGIKETSARTILQDVKVFAVNDTFRREHKDKSEEAITAKTVSLLVKPDEAELITLASELGNVRLVMRSTEDDSIAETGGAGVHRLLGQAGADSNRDDESLMQGQENDLLSMLNGGPSQPPAPPAAPAAPTPVAEPQPVLPPPWRMMLLLGPQAQQVEFDQHGGGIRSQAWDEGILSNSAAPAGPALDLPQDAPADEPPATPPTGEEETDTPADH
ncbi:MAG: Flp pilus assembly protein CpaB [Planctomycetaceae bacterium]|nr:Flp pilus assembly protein CpaB [Planctomycetaceae bacterium]